ncbi:MAG: PKD domain-containing protein [Paludibacter sp.]|nr:PKD domain-containing protein [Bacteroidales bacterium]MCM1069357.1 PKD domain-containing protein [Prevotella sp.]MCM1353877.1 PKD domain-containing protein [Bacteroides sp.]MCM1442873.1 PKD domain-containing protein [Muribaculum sp.]MCM1481918.1 PKD domain-containing protein [Paludibacter sp.]
MRRIRTYLLLASISLLWACKSNEVNFSYTPDAPRAGQNITFSNLTTEGEEWLWDFGDGGESTLKSPSKTYRKAGTYVVTLTADGKAHRKCSKEITVYDTIPTFSIDADNITYRKSITFTAVLYNPYSYTVTYAWSLPPSAVITAGDLTEKSVTAYFTEQEADAEVSLTLNIGNTEYTTTQTFHIYDTPAPSLIMATDAQLLRQRLFDNGEEAPRPIDTDADIVSHTTALLTQADTLYLIAHAGSTQTSALYALNMQNEQLLTIISTSTNNTNQVLSTGLIANDQCYVGGRDAIYHIPLSLRNALLSDNSSYLFAQHTEFPDMPSGNTTGISLCGNIWLWSTGQGICRFTADRNNMGMILTEYDIQTFGTDPIARKLYFVSGSKLWVSNIDGTYTRALTDNVIGAIAIDNSSNRIYFSRTDGVAYLPLVQTQNNQTAAAPILFNNVTGVKALCPDNTKR